jgi:hypothetical protein
LNQTATALETKIAGRKKLLIFRAARFNMCEFMSMSPSVARKALLFGCLAAALPIVAFGQTNYTPNGVEYQVAGPLPQDQTHSQLALSTTNGYLVWQDNISDGNGLGISALQLDGGFSGVNSAFRVNSTTANDQENAQVALLNNGGAVFAWQGGKFGFQHIYARFLSPGKTWLANDIQVNTFMNNMQVNPAMAVLTNGSVIVLWESVGQVSSTSMADVYGQLLTSSGAKSGGEFLVNQFTSYNQRTPTVAALSNGRFVVVWVSEQERWTDASGPPSVDIYGRVYDVYANPVGGEFLINTGTNICANPSVAGGSDGGFLVAWSQKDAAYTNGWDVYERPFDSALTGGTVSRVNTYTFGDQYAPKVAVSGTDYYVVWTSMGQDGSREGVYGKVMYNNGAAWGSETLINTTVVNGQIQPAIASDHAGRFMVSWSSFTGGASQLDVYAQRFTKLLPQLPAMNAPQLHVPFVFSNNVYQPQIEVFWTAQAGQPVQSYQVYVDGSGSPAASVTTNVWCMTAASGLAASATHSFQVAYTTTNGQSSPLSPPASAAAWSGVSYYGIPVEWMEEYWGAEWPPATIPLAPGGPTPLQAFMTGANPLEPATWLQTSLSGTAQGYYLNWNPQPGLTYQVQYSSNLTSWANLGAPRFAAGTSDSLYLGSNNLGYYRVLCLH